MIPETDDGQPDRACNPAALVVYPGSREIRRAVGALAWCCLEELSLGARHTTDGWIAPIGVRAVGAALGVTKDTAARAIQALISTGLVARRGSRSSAEYVLCLPAGVGICLDRHDGAERRGSQDTGPSTEDDTPLTNEIDAGRTLEDRPSLPSTTASSARVGGPRSVTPEVCPPNPKQSRRPHKRAVPQAAGQGSLFGGPSPDRCEVCGQPVPEWPARWLRTDDGRSFCPDHKGDTRFLR